MIVKRRDSTSRILPLTHEFSATSEISAAVDEDDAFRCPGNISCSADSLVMPHNATSRASGDDISTTIDWNSGV